MSSRLRNLQMYVYERIFAFDALNLLQTAKQARLCLSTKTKLDALGLFAFSVFSVPRNNVYFESLIVCRWRSRTLTKVGAANRVIWINLIHMSKTS